MDSRKINVAVVGLGFGWEFASIYKEHPNVRSVTVCDKNSKRLDEVVSKLGVRGVANFEDVLADKSIDAVHLVTGIPDHASQTIAALKSGRHCACTVPMATSIEDLKSIIATQKSSGKNYMMMETAVYTRQFLLAKEMKLKGLLGRLQLLRGAHYQDMENWPSYWAGLPPMWYATHAVSPLLEISGARAVKVHCFGSGEMREELKTQYGSPWPAETAIFQLSTPNLSAEVTRTLFHCARPYMESFTIYGENACYEWQMENEPPVLFRVSPETPTNRSKLIQEKPDAPDRQDLLTPEIRKFTKRFVYSDENTHLSFAQGGGHHGSHPHLVDEFILSIVENRKPKIDAVTAANWTSAGICAHQSALSGGAEVEIPSFD